MFLEERLSRISEEVQEKKYVSVYALAEKFNVSHMTIRRDLDYLSRRGILQRCHGGATVTEVYVYESDYNEKREVNREQKRRLAEKAATLIHDNDTVLLDAGTTTFELASLIANRENLTVITNDVQIATLLLHSKVSLIVAGGVVQKHTGTMMGGVTDRFLKEFRVEKVFIGCSSIDMNFDIFTPTPEKAFTKRQMLAIAKEKYLLADEGKFYKQATTYICNLSSFTGVISDKVFDVTEQKSLSDRKISIILP